MVEETQQNTNPTPVTSAAPTPEPAVQASAPAPSPASEGKSHKMMYVVAGILVIAVLVLGVAGYSYYKNSYKAPVAYSVPTSAPTPTVEATPTPLSQIENTSDIDKIQNELKNATDSGLQSDLNRANTEGNNL